MGKYFTHQTMAEFANLAGVVTKDLVETIGTGKYSASFVNWSRTLQLLRQHAPGWSVETKEAPDGGILFKAPVGGYLQLRAVHTDGTVGPWVPQAVMNNRNGSIAFDKIEARDITDTQRRGACMCLAYTFGLAAELWAKMKLESGWGASPEEATPAPKAGTQTTAAPVKAIAEVAKGSEPTEATFREAALDKGFTTYAVEGLLGIINGNYAKGVETVGNKTASEVETLNAKFAPKEAATSDEQW